VAAAAAADTLVHSFQFGVVDRVHLFLLKLINMVQVVTVGRQPRQQVEMDFLVPL
jgi:hypothetical protein